MIDADKKISSTATISEIAGMHYRTADVFRKYGIDFCCGGKLPLKTVCEMRELDLEKIQNELETAIHTICIPATLKFQEWKMLLKEFPSVLIQAQKKQLLFSHFQRNV